MVSELALLPNDRTLRRWNFTATVYMLASLAVDAAVGWHIWSLAELHRSLSEAADALSLTAGAIGLVGQVPVVSAGAGAGQLAGSITDTAEEVRRNAVTARRQVHVLLVASAREVTGLQQKLAGPVDALLVEHVAHAALELDRG